MTLPSVATRTGRGAALRSWVREHPVDAGPSPVPERCGRMAEEAAGYAAECRRAAAEVRSLVVGAAGDMRVYLRAVLDDVQAAGDEAREGAEDAAREAARPRPTLSRVEPGACSARDAALRVRGLFDDAQAAAQESGVVAPLPAPAQAVDPAQVYLAGLAASGRRSVERGLRVAWEILRETGPAVTGMLAPDSWAEVRYGHLQALRATLAEAYAPATANLYLAAVRGVLRAAWLLGQVEEAEYRRAMEVPAVRGSRLPAGHAVLREEMRAVLRGASEHRRATPAGAARDAVLLLLGRLGGLRREEMCGLDLVDVDFHEGTLRVTGKGNKQRSVPIHAALRAALEAWVEVRGAEPGALLCPVSQRGAVTVRRMVAQSIYDRLQVLCDRACVRPATPHDLRRTCASEALDASRDLTAVQALLGHADPRTTARYDRRGERAVRAAVDAMEVL